MSGTSRFRFRDKSGDEREVPSVEELSRHIEAGDLDSDTSLYDAGTGQWSRAGNVPVFQFIVDELQREGRLPDGFGSPSEPSATEPTDDRSEVEPPDSGSSTDEPPAGDGPPTGDEPPTEDEPPGRAEPPPAHEELPLTPDPFEMHLPRTATSDADSHTDEDLPEPESAGEAGSTSAGSDEVGPDNRPLSDWLMDRPGDGGASERGGEKASNAGSPSEVDDPPARPPQSDPWGRPHVRGLPGIEPLADDSASTRDDPADDPSGGTPESGWEGAADAAGGSGAPTGGIRSRPPPKRRDGLGRTTERRSARYRSMVIALIAGGGVVLAIAMFMLTGEGDPVDDPFAGEAASSSGADAELLLPPFPRPATSAADAGETPAEVPGTMEDLVMVELEGLLDSIRAERGVTVVPPAGWLGGSYLSTASDFGDVTEFWDDYESLIRQFGEEDADLYVEAARRAWYEFTDAPPTGDAEGLAGFLESVAERYETVGPIRAERYERRIRVADAARTLHTFLLRAESQIDHDPALGASLSRDPILEAVPRDPETRRELDQHLDRLFSALDQTRRGIPPALGGLRTELFHRLREPV